MSNGIDAMHLIAYTSTFTGNPLKVGEALADIAVASKTNNEKEGITGLLFYLNGDFLQIIEGPEIALEYLMEKLERDPRHSNIIRLVDEPTPIRGFAGWNMDVVNLSEAESLQQSEIENISNAFKQCMDTRSTLLSRFYQAMQNQLVKKS